MCVFLNISVLQGGVVSTSPNQQAGGPPLVGCLPGLLIQYIRSYPPYRRPSLYPQPEDAPCRGDRDPLHKVTYIYYSIISRVKYVACAKLLVGRCLSAFVALGWRGVGGGGVFILSTCPSVSVLCLWSGFASFFISFGRWLPASLVQWCCSHVETNFIKTRFINRRTEPQ